VPDRWVVKASPVITLAKAGHLVLLTVLATDVLLPEAVVAEVLDGPVTDPARQAVEGGWGTPEGQCRGTPVPRSVCAGAVVRTAPRDVWSHSHARRSASSHGTPPSATIIATRSAQGSWRC
jgi:hypothetical protein